MARQTYRLITRSDFDGLVCAVLLKELGMIDDIKFVHPKDMQDGTIQITDRDITTNLPYAEGVHLAFDHHISEMIRIDEMPENYVINADAPSAARVVYDHFGGKKRFPRISDDLMHAVDKADSGQFTRSEVLDPKGWALLNFLMDARTGLGRFREFRISNYQLMMDLIAGIRDLTVDEILALPDVVERIELFNDHRPKAEEQIKRCTKIVNTVAVYDLRGEDTIYACNRFAIYALFPDVNISMHIMWGLNRTNTVFAVGKSIFNRSSRVRIGELMLEYGGGGHENAGTCQILNDKAESVREELVARLASSG
jgi:nanoRNase/pAp phosphatase (c-di-AMP/oligoRNAs hydrolase)